MSQAQLVSPLPTRPNLPDGFKVGAVTATATTLPWDKAREQLAAARNYWLATTYPDGRIHIMPVWGVWLDNTLYFTTDASSQKARNIAANPNVALHLDSAAELVSLDGSAEAVSDAAVYERVADAYAAKYDHRLELGAENSSERLFVVHPNLAFTWRESDIGGSITRWLFRKGV